DHALGLPVPRFDEEPFAAPAEACIQLLSFVATIDVRARARRKAVGVMLAKIEPPVPAPIRTERACVQFAGAEASCRGCHRPAGVIRPPRNHVDDAANGVRAIQCGARTLDDLDAFDAFSWD